MTMTNSAGNENGLTAALGPLAAASDRGDLPTMPDPSQNPFGGNDLPTTPDPVEDPERGQRMPPPEPDPSRKPRAINDPLPHHDDLDDDGQEQIA